MTIGPNNIKDLSFTFSSACEGTVKPVALGVNASVTASLDHGR